MQLITWHVVAHRVHFSALLCVELYLTYVLISIPSPLEIMYGNLSRNRHCLQVEVEAEAFKTCERQKLMAGEGL